MYPRVIDRDLSRRRAIEIQHCCGCFGSSDRTTVDFSESQSPTDPGAEDWSELVRRNIPCDECGQQVARAMIGHPVKYVIDLLTAGERQSQQCQGRFLQALSVLTEVAEASVHRSPGSVLATDPLGEVGIGIFGD
ncbi:hypothetical protein CcI49_02900 [Frankia sp. CcI49]|nr:hypothetical protein CcI49_02900 [Frankia sp. CcI49]